MMTHARRPEKATVDDDTGITDHGQGESRQCRGQQARICLIGHTFHSSLNARVNVKRTGFRCQLTGNINRVKLES